MRRLSLRIFVSFFAAMLVIGAGAILITWWVFAERQDDNAATLRETAGRAAAALSAGGRPALEAWLRADAARRTDRPLLVLDEQGRELLGRPLPQRDGARRRAATALALEGAPGVVLRPPERLPVLVAADGARYRLLLPPRRPRGFAPPFVMPDTRMPLLLLAIAVTALVSFALARSITRPIGDLHRATRALAAGELHTRVAATTSRRRDELGRLAVSFDSMAARLATLIEVRERLLRDVSHELRSPLARMRLATGLARQQGADVPRQLERLETEIERLDELIGRVLDVARLDSGAGALSTEWLDLVELVDRIAADARFEAAGSGRRVDWQPPSGPFLIDADPGWLTAAIENVVRNALRHTPEDTAVGLDLQAEAGGGARLVVTDAGPGVPEDELERIFEPFHRVATARERASGGAGLGLAIAARVLRAHGGSIAAANLRPAPQVAPSGLAITLRLPGAPSAGPRPGPY